jgi:hypothetical protein
MKLAADDHPGGRRRGFQAPRGLGTVLAGMLLGTTRKVCLEAGARLWRVHEGTCGTCLAISPCTSHDRTNATLVYHVKLGGRRSRNVPLLWLIHQSCLGRVWGQVGQISGSISREVRSAHKKLCIVAAVVLPM